MYLLSLSSADNKIDMLAVFIAFMKRAFSELIIFIKFDSAISNFSLESFKSLFMVNNLSSNLTTKFSNLENCSYSALDKSLISLKL